MDEETLSKAVDPFFTTKGIGRGTGLGLSMVTGMAEQCGGKLVIRSTKGEGTTAEIWLPVALLGGPSAEPLADPAKAAPRVEPITILAVDDDEIVLINTAAMLGDVGHTVLQARSGHEALQTLGKNRVDLLITDYAMPGMTGEELIDAVQAGWPDLPVLIVSGYAEIPEGAALGIPRLAKPFRPHQLAAAVAEAAPKAGSKKVVSFPGGRAEPRR
jgi:CheY-like chemotaxis protein